MRYNLECLECFHCRICEVNTFVQLKLCISGFPQKTLFSAKKDHAEPLVPPGRVQCIEAANKTAQHMPIQWRRWGFTWRPKLGINNLERGASKITKTKLPVPDLNSMAHSWGDSGHSMFSYTGFRWLTGAGNPAALLLYCSCRGPKSRLTWHGLVGYQTSCRRGLG